MQSVALQTIMNQYGISMQLMKVNEAKSGLTNPKGEFDSYRCRISRQGKEINVYVAVPPEEGAITPSDVLFMLILDASGCEMFQEYYSRHHEFKENLAGCDLGPDGLDDFWLEYESRRRQSLKLQDLLGRNLYRKLIDRFGFDN